MDLENHTLRNVVGSSKTQAWQNYHWMLTNSFSYQPNKVQIAKETQKMMYGVSITLGMNLTVHQVAQDSCWVCLVARLLQWMTITIQGKNTFYLLKTKSSTFRRVQPLTSEKRSEFFRLILSFQHLAWMLWISSLKYKIKPMQVASEFHRQVISILQILVRLMKLGLKIWVFA